MSGDQRSRLPHPRAPRQAQDHVPPKVPPGHTGLVASRSAPRQPSNVPDSACRGEHRATGSGRASAPERRSLPGAAPTGLLRQSLIATGCRKFNSSPAVGIAYLVQHGLLRRDPDQVARLLRSSAELDAAAIGNYLSHRLEFNRRVLAAYISQLELTGLLLVPALRKLLERLQLPSDRERAARIVRCFAEEYCSLNPDMFEPADAPYVGDYALKLSATLSGPGEWRTDRAATRNPHDESPARGHLGAGASPGPPRLIPGAAGVVDGPLRATSSARREGWLYKQGGRIKTWKLRWFVLQENFLLYFRECTDRVPLGFVLLENLQLRVVHDPVRANCFELHVPVGIGGGRRRTVTAWKRSRVGAGSHHSIFRMSVETEEDRRDWMVAIQRSIVLVTARPAAGAVRTSTERTA